MFSFCRSSFGWSTAAKAGDWNFDLLQEGGLFHSPTHELLVVAAAAVVLIPYASP